LVHPGIALNALKKRWKPDALAAGNRILAGPTRECTSLKTALVLWHANCEVDIEWSTLLQLAVTNLVKSKHALAMMLAVVV
jgi:hypothetical protein